MSGWTVTQLTALRAAHDGLDKAHGFPGVTPWYASKYKEHRPPGSADVEVHFEMGFRSNRDSVEGRANVSMKLRWTADAEKMEWLPVYVHIWVSTGEITVHERETIEYWPGQGVDSGYILKVEQAS